MSEALSDKLADLDHQLEQTDDPLKIAAIYLQAGELLAAADEIDEACYFMTQAYVFASHHGAKPMVEQTKAFLRKYDRI